MEVIIFGNGESRNQFEALQFMGNFTTWGCNAIYRDIKVDNLVAIDYGMQQEIECSGYAKNNVCHFSDWSVLPNVDEMLLKTMKMNFEPHMIHETLRTDRTDCVIQGKDPQTAESNIKEALDKNPDLDYNDLRLKVEKDVGLYITWVTENNKIKNIEYPRDWCAGATAIHLACQEGATKVYMLGFDLSSYDSPLNNIYKGSKNYLPEYAKGFNPVNWNLQLGTVFGEFKDVEFIWVSPVHTILDKVRTKFKNVDFLTYEEIYKTIR
jgi:hypothetical protein